MKKLSSIIVIAILLLSFESVVAQVMLREIPLKQQIENSTLVVEGEVMAKKSFWDKNLIYTVNTIRVYKVFKGELLSTIDVITLGGAVDNDVLMVSSALKLKSGNTGLFILQKSDVLNSPVNKSSNKSYKPYGAIQGFYKYNLFDDLAVNPFNKKEGISSTFYKEITDITKANYVEISNYNVSKINKGLNQNKSLVTPSITSFNPTTVSAGTKTLLTINGSGFGGPGKVSFPDANAAGSVYIDALSTQIVSWSDTQIVVEVPSDAGTGNFRITNNDTPSALSTVSSNVLTISYSELNYEYDPGAGLQAYPIQHYAQSVNGGYIWKMQTDFFNDTEHPGAKDAFKRALETWRCTSKINWTISSNANATDVVASDGTNIIRFDNGPELDSGVLGTCYTWASRYTGCSSGAPVQYFVKELDIVFNDTTNWYYGAGTPSGSQYDFESVAVHELGHGHQLGHVRDVNAIMHFSLGPGEYNRVLSSNDTNAAIDVQSRSTSTSVCGILDPMTNYAGVCTLSVDDLALKDGIEIYPNPSNGQFYISNDLSINLKKVVIYDISGRLISSFDISGNSKTKTIDLIGASKGVYFATIHSDKGFVTKKIVLE